MLVKDINQEEIYIVNSINGVRDLSKQKDSELKIETKIDNIKNSAK